MWSRRDEYGDYPDDDYTDPYARRVRDKEARGKASRVDAEHRTLESFNERQQEWADPIGRQEAIGGDNVDHEWDRKTRDRNDRAMYDSRVQLSARGDERDEAPEDRDERGKGERNKDANWRTDIKLTRPRGQEDGLDDVEGGKGRGRDWVFTDMSWRDEERALGPRHNDRDWRNYVRNDRTDELYDKKAKPAAADNEAQKRKAERDWKKTKDKADAGIHVVCVDETADAERAFKFAARNLPREHRLVLTHGLYEGLLGHNRSDELRLHRVGNKYLQACSELGRDCTFRHFHYTSSGNFGEEVCDLAQRAHAKSVLVGKRSQVSDLRRSLAGSTSRSVLEACRIPVTIVAKGEKGLANSTSW